MIILIILIIVLLLSFTYIKNLFKNDTTILDDVKLKKSEPSNNGFALMLEKEDGSGYKQSTSNNWPTDMVFNSELSGCMDANGNIIENGLKYNTSTNSVKIRVNGEAYCYIYFDNIKPAVTLTVSTDGKQNNYYKQVLSCDDGTNSSFSIKYQRLEISNVGKISTNCSLNYTNDTNTYILLSSEVQSKATEITSTNNAEDTDTSYRYTGKEPDNYVWFNNEMWRIIGLIPVCLESGCGTPDTSLVKIIRKESIGGIAYDAKSSEYTGVWGSNTLYKLLNEAYYGKINANNTSLDVSNYCSGNYTSEYKGVPNCDYKKIGISSNSSDYYGRMVKEVYWNTGAASAREANVPTIYKNETATQTVSGKIGLMSASDYGYAGTDYINAVYSSTFVNNTSSNWLFGQSYEWTNIKSLYGLLRVCSAGHVDYYKENRALVVRPTLYLDSSVYIISGDGTESNPYILGM